MKHDFIKLSTKKKCAMLLLSCMDWGCHAKGYLEIENKIRKRLKFQYEFDIIRFRSCIDLIEDTEDAICYFSKYGLQKFSPKINDDIGEIYLKLYGILNVIYLQINTIVEIFEVCKVPDKSVIYNQLRNHTIFELRNIVGAHTINFEERAEYIPENFNKNFFRITQCQLNAKGDNLHAVDGFHHVREYNLYELVMDYNEQSEKILYNACINYMESIFKTSIHKKDELLTHYELVPFKNFDYRKLYKNDRMQKRFINAIYKSSKSNNSDTPIKWDDLLKSDSYETIK